MSLSRYPTGPKRIADWPVHDDRTIGCSSDCKCIQRNTRGFGEYILCEQADLCRKGMPLIGL